MRYVDRFIIKLVAIHIRRTVEVRIIRKHIHGIDYKKRKYSYNNNIKLSKKVKIILSFRRDIRRK